MAENLITKVFCRFLCKRNQLYLENSKIDGKYSAILLR